MAGPSTRSTGFCPSLTYADAPGAIEWLCKAFGFSRRLVVHGEDGRIVHAELALGDGVVMVSSPKPEQHRVARDGGMDTCLTVCVPVDDPDAHYARAREAGAEIVQELEDADYGSRGYLARDLEGYGWYFGTYRPGAYWSEDGAPVEVHPGAEA